MSDYTPEIESLFNGTIKEEDVRLLAEFFALNAYNGFDGVMTRREFVARCKLAGIPPAHALGYIVSWYVSRGTKTPGDNKNKRTGPNTSVPSKPLTGLATEAKNQIEKLIKDLRIEGRITSGSNSKTLTIGRIVAASPGFIAKAIAAMIGNNVPVRLVAAAPTGYPTYLCFPQAGSIIPRSRPDLFNLYVVYYKENDRIINNNVPSENTAQYVKTIYESTLIKEEDRVKILAECENLSRTVSKGVIEAYNIARERSMNDSSAPAVTLNNSGNTLSGGSTSSAVSSSVDPNIIRKSAVLGSIIQQRAKDLVNTNSTFSDVLLANYGKMDKVVNYFTDVSAHKISIPEFNAAILNKDLFKRAINNDFSDPESKTEV